MSDIVLTYWIPRVGIDTIMAIVLAVLLWWFCDAVRRAVKKKRTR